MQPPMEGPSYKARRDVLEASSASYQNASSFEITAHTLNNYLSVTIAIMQLKTASALIFFACECFGFFFQWLR
jgi:hypothetical protein